jgi:integrase
MLLYYLDPFTRREVSKTAGTADRGEAERAAARWEAELLDLRGDGDDAWKFFRDRLREEYFPGVSPKTSAVMTSALNHYSRLLNPARVSDVTGSTASVFAAKLAADGIAQASVFSYLTNLKVALNWAESVGMVAKAPKIKLPRQADRTFMRGRPIVEDEYHAMLKACKIWGDEAPAFRRLLDLLWLSGLRLSEALALSWDRPPIYVNLDAKPHPQMLFFAEGHKARRDEAVPIPPDLAEWLRQTPPRNRRGLIAPVAHRRVNHISLKVSKIGEAAGVRVNDDAKAASAHDFRRAFGLRWAQVLMPIHLKTLMRHCEIKTTLRYYVGQSAADLGRIMWGESVPKKVPKTVSKRRKAG